MIIIIEIVVNIHCNKYHTERPYIVLELNRLPMIFTGAVCIADIFEFRMAIGYRSAGSDTFTFYS